MSVLTKEQKIELLDTWCGFDPINDEEQKIMCHFAVIHDEKRAHSNTTVDKPEWLTKIRPLGGYKELFNKKHLPKKRYPQKFCRILRYNDSIRHLAPQRTTAFL